MKCHDDWSFYMPDDGKKLIVAVDAAPGDRNAAGFQIRGFWFAGSAIVVTDMDGNETAYVNRGIAITEVK